MNWISVKDRLPDGPAGYYWIVIQRNFSSHAIIARFDRDTKHFVAPDPFDCCEYPDCCCEHIEDVAFWRKIEWPGFPEPLPEKYVSKDDGLPSPPSLPSSIFEFGALINPPKLHPTSRLLMNEEFESLRPAFGVSEKLCGKIED